MYFSENRDAPRSGEDQWGSENQRVERHEGGGAPRTFNRGPRGGRGGLGDRQDRRSGSDKTGVKAVEKKGNGDVWMDFLVVMFRWSWSCQLGRPRGATGGRDREAGKH